MPADPRLTALAPRVLAACRDLDARGIYPTAAALRAVLRSAGAADSTIRLARRSLVDAGLYRLPYQRPHPRGAAARDAALRAELAHRRFDDPRPVAGKLLIDQMGSPGLDALSPAEVSAIVRRRCRGVSRPGRRAASA